MGKVPNKEFFPFFLLLLSKTQMGTVSHGAGIASTNESADIYRGKGTQHLVVTLKVRVSNNGISGSAYLDRHDPSLATSERFLRIVRDFAEQTNITRTNDIVNHVGGRGCVEPRGMASSSYYPCTHGTLTAPCHLPFPGH